MNDNKGFSIDWALLTGLLTLSVISLFVLYSAGDQNSDMLIRQSIRIVLSFAVLFLVARITPDQFLRWTPYLYGIGLILLIVVLGAGVIGKGAQRWIDLGFVRFQPAEMMKLAVPMMVAWVMVTYCDTWFCNCHHTCHSCYQTTGSRYCNSDFRLRSGGDLSCRYVLADSRCTCRHNGGSSTPGLVYDS